MAKTITQLPDATVVNAADELIVQQGGVTKRATKTEVLNGIVNANVDANAAIAGTKIAPNFGSQNIVTTGNVGIGTTSPSYAADIRSASNTTMHIQGNTSGVRCGSSVDTPVVDAGYFGTYSNHPTVFGTNNAERMRIDSSGNVGIGTASPATRLHVDGTIRYTNRPVAGTITAIGFDANGDLRAASSSLRYKNNVEPYSKGLSEVAQLEPVTFNYNGEELVNAGLIVEDLDELGLEEFVLRDAEGTADAIPYGNMVALLINAIKELKVRVEELEAAQ